MLVPARALAGALNVPGLNVARARCSRAAKKRPASDEARLAIAKDPATRMPLVCGFDARSLLSAQIISLSIIFALSLSRARAHVPAALCALLGANLLVAMRHAAEVEARA